MTCGRRVLLAGLSAEILLERRTRRASDHPGAFLRVAASRGASFVRASLGRIVGVERIVLTHREEPFWMNVGFGRAEVEVPPETQFLLAKLRDRTFLLLVPLFGTRFRFSLAHHGDDLTLIGETGDPSVVGRNDLALYVAHGSDPYALIQAGARQVASRMKARLRTEKTVPDIADLFGWCTWDAFYQEVDADRVRAGLESFRRGGVAPRYVILDDGWQHTRRTRTGEPRLASFRADPRKFPRGLAPLVAQAKRLYGVKRFLVWHTLTGYWSGVDLRAFRRFGAYDVLRNYGPGILAHSPGHNVEWWGQLSGMIPPSRIREFYREYHRRLASVGVDGVKVDNQAVLEALAWRTAGRVPLTRAYRRALEVSAREHFDGRLINCMSNANETHLMARDSTLLRTSIDFWPQRAETHGRHLCTNAFVSLWFGEFILPDWDMFQSGHAWGSFHAAARAVSGSPVYVSDKPGQHDFSLLRRLVLPDGTVARCDGPARPAPACLFADATKETRPLKIFNLCGAAAVVGVFHCRHGTGRTAPVQHARVTRADVPGLPAGRFATFAHASRVLRAPSIRPGVPLTLNPGGWEIVTLAPEERGVAVVGLADMLNPAATITHRGWSSATTYTVALRASGRLLAWSRRRPSRVLADGLAVGFTWKRGRLDVPLPARAGPLRVALEFAASRKAS